MTLKAKPEAQERAATENSKPWLERPVDVPIGKHRHEQREARRKALENEISAAVAKQRAKAQRKNAAVQYNAPTAQRAAKAIEVTSKTEIPGHGPVAPVKSHKVEGPIEKYGDGWSPELERAARDIRDIFLLAASTPRMTASYEGFTTAGSPSGRHGGVQDHIRDAQAMATVIEQRFPMFRNDIHWFITELVCAQDGSTMKFEESGRRLLRIHGVPDNAPEDEKYLWRSPDAQKGAGYGAFLRTLQVLEWFLAEQRESGWGWRKRFDNPEAARALAVELRARAQVMREQQARKAQAEKRLKRG